MNLDSNEADRTVYMFSVVSRASHRVKGATCLVGKKTPLVFWSEMDFFFIRDDLYQRL